MKQYIAEICDNIGKPVKQFSVWADNLSEATSNAASIRDAQHKEVRGYLRVKEVNE